MHWKTKNGALRTGPGSSKFRSPNYTIMSIDLLYFRQNYFSWPDFDRCAVRDCGPYLVNLGISHSDAPVCPVLHAVS